MVLRGFLGHSSSYNQSRHVVRDGVSQALYKQVHRLSGATEIKPPRSCRKIRSVTLESDLQFGEFLFIVVHRLCRVFTLFCPDQGNLTDSCYVTKG